jgi:hypothetical protein
VDEFVVLLEMGSGQKDQGPFLDSFVKRLSVPVDYEGPGRPIWRCMLPKTWARTAGVSDGKTLLHMRWG